MHTQKPFFFKIFLSTIPLSWEQGGKSPLSISDFLIPQKFPQPEQELQTHLEQGGQTKP